MENVNEKLLNIISELIEEEEFSNELIMKSDFIEELKFDSILFVSMIINIEKEFNIEIKVEYVDIERLSNFSSLLEMLKEHGVY